MRILDFYICKFKGADQLCSYCTADPRLCFRHTDSTIPLLTIYFQNVKFLAFFCDCKDQFESDLVGNSEDRTGNFFLIAPFPDHCLLLHFSLMSWIISDATHNSTFHQGRGVLFSVVAAVTRASWRIYTHCKNRCFGHS